MWKIERDGKLGNLNNHLMHRGSFTQFAYKYCKQNKFHGFLLSPVKDKHAITVSLSFMGDLQKLANKKHLRVIGFSCPIPFILSNHEFWRNKCR